MPVVAISVANEINKVAMIKKKPNDSLRSLFCSYLNLERRPFIMGIPTRRTRPSSVQKYSSSKKNLPSSDPFSGNISLILSKEKEWLGLFSNLSRSLSISEHKEGVIITDIRVWITFGNNKVNKKYNVKSKIYEKRKLFSQSKAA